MRNRSAFIARNLDLLSAIEGRKRARLTSRAALCAASLALLFTLPIAASARADAPPADVAPWQLTGIVCTIDGEERTLPPTVDANSLCDRSKPVYPLYTGVELAPGAPARGAEEFQPLSPEGGKD